MFLTSQEYSVFFRRPVCALGMASDQHHFVWHLCTPLGGYSLYPGKQEGKEYFQMGFVFHWLSGEIHLFTKNSSCSKLIWFFWKGIPGTVEQTPQNPKLECFCVTQAVIDLSEKMNYRHDRCDSCSYN